MVVACVGLEPRVQRGSWVARPRPVPQSGAGCGLVEPHLNVWRFQPCSSVHTSAWMSMPALWPAAPWTADRRDHAAPDDSGLCRDSCRGSSRLPAPVRVVYEAGPTGFRAGPVPAGRRDRPLVAAPSKLQRPSGDRVKTDARDALHLARLALKLGEITAVRVPAADQEAARDLVRAREDVRGGSDAVPAPDLQAPAAPRHRLFGREGLDRRPPTWLHRQHFEAPPCRPPTSPAWRADA